MVLNDKGGVAMTLTGRATDPHHVPCIIEEADEGILGNGDRPGECRNHAGWASYAEHNGRTTDTV